MSDTLGNWKRSAYCGAVGEGHIGQSITRWLGQKRRDHGGLIFVDPRDRDGLSIGL